MRESIKTGEGHERRVELEFVAEVFGNSKDNNILDVGGIPTDGEPYPVVMDAINANNIKLEVCDFRGGEYAGDFISYDFDKQFDAVLFLSSLEHFPQCTEGDMIYRKGEDIKGFQKALDILKPKGKIFLTVPYGKPIWQPYHQNYNMPLIKELSKGAILEESYTYKLLGDDWILSDPNSFNDIYYTSRAFGVGCFVFGKPE